MKQPNKIVIDQIEYIRADTVQPPAGDYEIVVADRGWIFCGRVDRTQEGAVWVRQAKNIRTWEKGGFGGLTKGAKTAGATLDDSGDICLRSEAVLFTVPVSQDWQNE